MGYPKIQGEFSSFAEIEIRGFIHGGPMVETKDYAALDWDDSLEGEEVYGTGPDKLGDTVGQYKAAGTMTMYRHAAMQFQQILQNAKPQAPGIGIIRFDIIVNWTPLSLDGEVLNAQLLGCRIKQRQSSNATGTAASQIVMPLMITKVIDPVRLI